MKKKESDNYVCPSSLKKLNLEIFKEENDVVIEGILVSEDKIIFPIKKGIPDLTWPQELQKIDEETRKAYDKLAIDYDKYASIPFQTYNCDEILVRQKMIEQLNIKTGDNILEVGCGDGRGSEQIAEKLNNSGKLYLQELSPSFLNKALERLKKYEKNIEIEYSVANACYLSFPDNFFDAAHHFGGINTFSDVKRSLSELSRVVKPGGKVLVGDESMAPWLRETMFGKIMMNSNPLLKYEIPLKDIPTNARDVKLEWIMMGAFFILEFTVGEGEPEANYHINIPSERGGNHWTRFFGNLEGITDETKKLAYQAQKKSGLSMHEWLDKIVKEESVKFLDKENNI